MSNDLRFAPADPATIEPVWRARWGIPLVTLERTFQPQDVESLAMWEGNQLRALVTWHREGDTAEIVTLDALRKGQGDGTRMLREIESRLAAEGVRRMSLVTTNDNIGALMFYSRRGWRLVRVHLDGVQRVRAHKPLPEIGPYGMKIRDLWEFERDLAA